jgi:3-oxoacyl-[acyl-carrier-protein] synthase II
MARKSEELREVVVTGIGPVSAVGRRASKFFEAMLEGVSAACPIPQSHEQRYNWKSRWHVPCPSPEPSGYGLSKALVRLMDKPSLLACEAARYAIEDAGLACEPKGRGFAVPDLEEGAVVMGMGASHIDSVFGAYRGHHELFKDTYPMMTAACVMVNAPAAWISILFGMRKESLSLSTACASGTMAIGEAYRKIAFGLCDIALAGGVECLEDPYGVPMRSFDVLGALTKTNDGNPRVFSHERSGFLFGDGGACVLVLEDKQRALGRGAPIYAEISRYVAASEAFNIVQMEPSGMTVDSVLSRLKGDRPVDYLNAHGTGTIPNDALERDAIVRVFGDEPEQPLVSSSKNQLGHTIAASGAFEAAITALSIRHQKVHGLTTGSLLENLNIVTRSRPARIERAISVSYGFGGHDAGLLLERCEAPK